MTDLARQDRIRNAVSFLNHPKVVGSSESAQKSFLVGKGLSDEEVEEAFRLAKDSKTEELKLIDARSLESNLARSSPDVNRAGWRWTQLILYTGFALGGLYAANATFGEYVSRFFQSKRRNEEGREAAIHGSRLLEEILHLREAFDRSLQEGKEIREDTQAREESVVHHLQGLQSTLDKIHDALESRERDGSSIPIALAGLEGRLSDVQERLVSVEDRSMERSLHLDCELAEVKSMLRLHPPSVPDVDVDGEVDGKGADEPEEGSTMRKVADASELRSHPLVSETPSEAPSRKDASKEPTNRPSRSVPSPSDTTSMERPPHPSSYLDVLAMLEKGETPPGIRTDVLDLPPDPRQVPSTSRKILPAKPWSERTSNRGTMDETDPEPMVDGWHPPSPPLPSLSNYTV